MDTEILNLLKLCPCFENISEENELNGLKLTNRRN